VTDEQILDGFHDLREFLEFSLARLEHRMDRQLGSADHRTMRKLASVDQRLDALEVELRRLKGVQDR
jgi:hypothetical protein